MLSTSGLFFTNSASDLSGPDIDPYPLIHTTRPLLKDLDLYLVSKPGKFNGLASRTILQPRDYSKYGGAIKTQSDSVESSLLTVPFNFLVPLAGPYKETVLDSSISHKDMKSISDTPAPSSLISAMLQHLASSAVDEKVYRSIPELLIPLW
ncbi:hypothetical protein GYMLUDRAFT_235975 [Collybiopsis luxurians FD-317 M1]|nr:hypothetical protein GYMLUDRAFT_235975 [Collybiopsis luxurians FD-317 M1]